MSQARTRTGSPLHAAGARRPYRRLGVVWERGALGDVLLSAPEPAPRQIFWFWDFGVKTVTDTRASGLPGAKFEGWSFRFQVF